MNPLVTMTNYTSILFPPEPFASVELLDVASSTELIDGLIDGIETVTGRRLAESEFLAELRELLPFQMGNPNPLEPIENDPTWFIDKFDQDQAKAKCRAKYSRTARRDRARLAAKIAAALEAEKPAKLVTTVAKPQPRTFARLDLDAALAITDGLACASSSTFRFFRGYSVNNEALLEATGRDPYYRDVEPIRLSHLLGPSVGELMVDDLREYFAAIERVSIEGTRQELHLLFWRQNALCLLPNSDFETSVEFALAPAPSSLDQIETAGGKTGRYTPLD